MLLSAFLFTSPIVPYTFASSTEPRCVEVLRVRQYQSVTRISLQYNPLEIFQDPRDTETISAVGLQAVRPRDSVLELGPGSGISANAFSKQGGARKVTGLEISAASVAHAQATYSSPSVAFHLADYAALSTEQILSSYLNGEKPDLVVSNPPYVPSLGHGTGLFRTIDGGTDGLRFIRRVIEIASHYGSRLAFILGSYSNPLEAFQILEAQGYQITQLTFSVLPFGDFSKANQTQILNLEREGKAFLLRNVYPGQLAYVAIGMTADKKQMGASSLTYEKFSLLIRSLTLATTPILETLPATYPIPIQVLELPDHP